MQNIRLKRNLFDRETTILFWLYTKQESYKLTGTTASIFRWVNKNIDSNLPYVYHAKVLGKQNHDSSLFMLCSMSLVKDGCGRIITPSMRDKKVSTLMGVHHPVAKLHLMPYEKYINRIVKGDSSLEYTVNCYNQKQKYALVQKELTTNKIYKLVALFKTFPRHYIQELDDLL